MLLLCCGCLLTAPGCNVVGFVTLLFAKVDAKHELTNRPTLVMVEDPETALANTALPDAIATEIGQKLLENGATHTVIDTNRLATLRNEMGDRFRKTPIDEIGRRVGAEQIIYVKVLTVIIQNEPGMIKPSAVLAIKLVDAQTGERLFPNESTQFPVASPLSTSDRTSYPLVINQRMEMVREGATGTTDTIIRSKMAKVIAREIARLFYTHRPQIGEDVIE